SRLFLRARSDGSRGRPPALGPGHADPDLVQGGRQHRNCVPGAGRHQSARPSGWRLERRRLQERALGHRQRQAAAAEHLRHLPRRRQPNGKRSARHGARARRQPDRAGGRVRASAQQGHALHAGDEPHLPGHGTRIRRGPSLSVPGRGIVCRLRTNGEPMDCKRAVKLSWALAALLGGCSQDIDPATPDPGPPPIPGNVPAPGATNRSDVWDDLFNARRLDYNLALRTAALKLVGDLPTLQEIEDVHGATDPATVYAQKIDAYLADRRFSGALVRFFRNSFRTGGPGRDTAATFAAMLVV